VFPGDLLSGFINYSSADGKPGVSLTVGKHRSRFPYIPCHRRARHADPIPQAGGFVRPLCSTATGCRRERPPFPLYKTVEDYRIGLLGPGLTFLAHVAGRERYTGNTAARGPRQTFFAKEYKISIIMPWTSCQVIFGVI